MSDASHASAGAKSGSGAAPSAAPKKPPSYAPFFRMIGEDHGFKRIKIYH
jgi:hypothetical protein